MMVRREETTAGKYCEACGCTPCQCFPSTTTFLGVNTGITVRTAWECIRCHRINAPHLDVCDCPIMGSIEGAYPSSRNTG